MEPREDGTRDERFLDVNDDEQAPALPGEARPGDRVLFHFRYCVYGGAVIGPALLPQDRKRGLQRIHWDDGDQKTLVALTRDRQCKNGALASVRQGQWVLARRGDGQYNGTQYTPPSRPEGAARAASAQAATAGMKRAAPAGAPLPTPQRRSARDVSRRRRGGRSCGCV